MIIANSPYLKLQNIFFAREFVKWLVIILSRHQLHKITPSFSFLLPLAVVDSDAKKNETRNLFINSPGQKTREMRLFKFTEFV